MRQEVLGVERRRRWPDGQKVSILCEVGVNGATVSDVARRHDIVRQNIYQWRVELRRKGLWCGETARFLAVEIDSGAALHEPLPSAPVGLASSSVEIVLNNGRRLRLDADVSDTVMARLIRVTETA